MAGLHVKSLVLIAGIPFPSFFLFVRFFVRPIPSPFTRAIPAVWDIQYLYDDFKDDSSLRTKKNEITNQRILPAANM